MLWCERLFHQGAGSPVQKIRSPLAKILFKPPAIVLRLEKMHESVGTVVLVLPVHDIFVLKR